MVWGKVVVEIRPDRIPTKITCFDEQAALARTMSFEDIREVDGRQIPIKMGLTPEDKPGEYTEVVYDALRFGVDIPPSTFTLQALKHQERAAGLGALRLCVRSRPRSRWLRGWRIVLAPARSVRRAHAAAGDRGAEPAHRRPSDRLRPQGREGVPRR